MNPLSINRTYFKNSDKPTQQCYAASDQGLYFCHSSGNVKPLYQWTCSVVREKWQGINVSVCLGYIRYITTALYRYRCNYKESTRSDQFLRLPLRKHAYSNILKLLQPKNENFQIKSYDIFHIPVQNIDCGYSLEPPRRGGSNEFPQSMFLSRNKINYVYPCKPSFTIQKWDLKGTKLMFS